jgi:3-phenylpropionate/trans-cinnamate dioxygenase ferredoxin subunit
MDFMRAASVKDLNPGEKLGVVLDGKPVLLVNLENEYYAIGGKCAHWGCMLIDGKLEDSRIRCKCHGSTFELKTGAVIKGPATKPEPSYRVKVENGEIYVEV